ncbi:hypothetical protein [Nonomuraea aurantiaca]|uniref:hypothetical protein n=1 Tax=Nonomuraea aurantiaca TaxID=2878562 RepID=UPI001CDA29A8|nr:hypothetical protein [Nonomuraea aurantiaca]MCA2220538.1 hypothetical protein [Nonomuraea aurantiaca]
MNDYQQQDFPTAAVPRTAPTQQSRPGLRVTPAILSGAAAVVVLMLFTVLFLLTRQPDKTEAVAVPVKTTRAAEPSPSEASPTEQATTSEPAPTGAATFTKTVDPCTVTDEDLVKKLTLFPDKTQIKAEECEWSTLAPGSGMPGNMQFRLQVYVKVFPGDVAAAHEQFRAQRQEAVLLAKISAPAEPPIGDASWTTLYTLPGDTGRGPTIATAGVRVSNAVIQVTYQRRVTEDPAGRLTKGALDMARSVAEKLGTSN